MDEAGFLKHHPVTRRPETECKQAEQMQQRRKPSSPSAGRRKSPEAAPSPPEAPLDSEEL